MALNSSPALNTTHSRSAAIDEILAEENIHPVTQASDVLWSLDDHIGSIRDVVRYNPATNTTQVANHLFYDAFGNIVSESDVNLEHRFAFTGREWDEEIDLQYNRAPTTTRLSLTIGISLECAGGSSLLLILLHRITSS